MAKVGGNLVREWQGRGLPLSAGMGCVVAFTCPCSRPKIYGGRTPVAYSIVHNLGILRMCNAILRLRKFSDCMEHLHTHKSTLHLSVSIYAYK